jgi:hypothetical protein
VNPKPIVGPGHVIAEMQGQSLYLHKQLHADYEIEKIIEWMFEDDEAADAFRNWLSCTCSSAGKVYGNDTLVAIAEPLRGVEPGGDWWPCAYSSDSGMAGMCEVRLIQ